mmetsp:Transcript_70155/g.126447  ORF Transcript_70155/g.126447 Transcript_70155/m.126447 type:complete len:217 (+) Transcript_70155:177-827(+)
MLIVELSVLRLLLRTESGLHSSKSSIKVLRADISRYDCARCSTFCTSTPTSNRRTCLANWAHGCLPEKLLEVGAGEARSTLCYPIDVSSAKRPFQAESSVVLCQLPSQKRSTRHSTGQRHIQALGQPPKRRKVKLPGHVGCTHQQHLVISSRVSTFEAGQELVFDPSRRLIVSALALAEQGIDLVNEYHRWLPVCGELKESFDSLFCLADPLGHNC